MTITFPETERLLIEEYEKLTKRIFQLTLRKSFNRKRAFDEALRRELLQAIARKRFLIKSLNIAQDGSSTEIKLKGLVNQLDAILSELNSTDGSSISLNQGSCDPIGLYTTIQRDIFWQFSSFSSSYRIPNFYHENHKQFDYCAIVNCLLQFKIILCSKRGMGYFELEKQVIKAFQNIDDIAQADYIKYYKQV